MRMNFLDTKSKACSCPPVYTGGNFPTASIFSLLHISCFYSVLIICSASGYVIQIALAIAHSLRSVTLIVADSNTAEKTKYTFFYT